MLLRCLGRRSRYFYQPLGVGVVIPPWNFPTAILTGMSSAAIVAGNTIVLKPSETTSVLGAKIAEIFEEAGLPDGVLNFCPGYGGEVGDYLVDDVRTRFVSFTGSMQTGLRINERAAKQRKARPWIKRVIAEMGGKDAMVIDDSADTEAAADDIVKSAYGYAGQKCSAASRAILHADIYDEVLAKVIEKARALNVGVPDASGHYGGTRPERAPVREGRGLHKQRQAAGRAGAGRRARRRRRRLLREPDRLRDGPGFEDSAGGDLRPRPLHNESPRLLRSPPHSQRYALRLSPAASTPKTATTWSRPAPSSGPATSTSTGASPAPSSAPSPSAASAMSGTDSKAGGPDYLPLHMLPRTVVEKF